MTALILLSKFRETEIEIWRSTAVADYEVSNLGRVRSFREARKPPPVRFRGRIRKPFVLLRPSATRSAYPTVCLTIEKGKERNFPVHRLVAEAFVGNPEGKPEVNHKTGLKADARADNLEWVTLAENKAHAAKYGLVARGEKHGRARLTESDIRLIWALRDQGYTSYEIAEAVGKVGWSMVCRILAGKNWKHVSGC